MEEVIEQGSNIATYVIAGWVGTAAVAWLVGMYHHFKALREHSEKKAKEREQYGRMISFLREEKEKAEYEKIIPLLAKIVRYYC